jgi:hypothetical protein
MRIDKKRADVKKYIFFLEGKPVSKIQEKLNLKHFLKFATHSSFQYNILWLEILSLLEQ